MKMTRRVVRYDGTTDLAPLIGQPATFVTFEGAALVGTVERFEGMRAIIRFADGTWAYGDNDKIEQPV